MIIRRIQQEDNKRVAELIRSPFDELNMEREHTVYTDPTTDCQYEVFSQCPRAVLWVAEDEGHVVGSCGVYPTNGLPEGWCEVVKFYVDRRCRGTGIGSQLFSRALRSALCLGYQTAYLETFPQFAGAVGIYERLGFQRLDHQVGQSGHTATSLWMTKQLRQARFDDETMRWKTLKAENIVHRAHLDAFRDTVQLPDGRVVEEFYRLHFAPVACVVAETTDGRLVMERQYRHAADEVLTEIPAGIVEAGEDPMEAARRELAEETGFTGGTWLPLSVEYAQGGVQDNLMYSFCAKGVERLADRHLDSTEDIHVYTIDKAEVLGMLINGEIRQGPLTPALWKYFALHTDLLR